jgi:proteasome accessory factor B
MYVRPDGQDGFEYDVEIPTIKSVVSTPETAKPDQSPEQKYNEALATFAKDNDAVLTFGYAKGKSKPVEQRRVEPETIYHNKGRTIIVGNDPDRDDVRAFRLDRICGRAHV